MAEPTKQADLMGKAKNTLLPTEEEGGNGGYSKSCKHGGVVHHVLTVGKAKLWAGGVNDVRRAIQKGQDFQLLLCVGGPSIASQVTDSRTALGGTAAKLLSRLNRKVGGESIRQRMMVIDWPDFGAPPVGSQWWQLLYEDLTKNVDGNVAIFCMGGHGRTGTALTILSWLNGDTGEGDPIAWVREKYCDHAVESSSQINYLAKMGIKTQVGGYKEGGYTSSSKSVTITQSKWAPDDKYGAADECDMCHDEKGTYSEELMCFIGKQCKAAGKTEVLPKVSKPPKFRSAGGLNTPCLDAEGCKDKATHYLDNGDSKYEDLCDAHGSKKYGDLWPTKSHSP